MTAPYLGALRQPERLDGIDVSRVQGRIDWRAVRAAGFEWACVKAAEGSGYTDPMVRNNVEGAQSEGLRAFCYSFARPSADVSAQLSATWRSLPSAGLVALDLETVDGLEPAQIVDFANRWIEGWRKYSMIRPIVYTFRGFAPELAAAAAGSPLSSCALWLAQYQSTTEPWIPEARAWPTPIKPWGNVAMWQYSGNGGFRVPGVPGDCDRDLFAGSHDDLDRLLGLK